MAAFGSTMAQISSRAASFPTLAARSAFSRRPAPVCHARPGSPPPAVGSGTMGSPFCRIRMRLCRDLGDLVQVAPGYHGCQDGSPAFQSCPRAAIRSRRSTEREALHQGTGPGCPRISPLLPARPSARRSSSGRVSSTRTSSTGSRSAAARVVATSTPRCGRRDLHGIIPTISNNLITAGALSGPRGFFRAGIL